LENPENNPTLIVLDDLMDFVYSTKVGELFTKDQMIVTSVWF